MAYLIDTDVLIDHLSGRLAAPAVEWLHAMVRAGQVCTSVIVLHELWTGAQTEAARKAVTALVQDWPVVEVSTGVALEGGEIRRRGRKEGVTLHAPDALIAGTATLHGLTVVTRNGKDFPYTKTVSPGTLAP